MALSRRNFVVGGAVAAVAAGAVGLSPLELSLSRAAAAQGRRQAPGFYRTKVGKIEVTSLLDGGMTLGDDLLIGADADMLKESRRDNFIRNAKDFPAYVNGFVINNGKKITLVDTGAKGYAPTLGNFASNLAASGIEPEQVDEIIITHAHPDHTNGLLNGESSRAFERATIRIAAEELDFWYDDAQMAAHPSMKQMFDFARRNLDPYKKGGRIETFAKNADLGGGLSAIHLPGHTPGHSGVRVSSGREQLVIWGDIVHIPAVQFANPAVSIAFDTDPDAARATRAAILDEVATDRIRIAGMHLVFPAIGHALKQDSGYRYVPQAWETES
ncbi:MAG: MBL fold metallo-hydrolase [Micavibrio sp.]